MDLERDQILKLLKDLRNIGELIPSKKVPYHNLINKVKDRPGHDLKYSIDSSKIQSELGWVPNHSFESALKKRFVGTLKIFIGVNKFCLNQDMNLIEKVFEAIVNDNLNNQYQI